MEALKELLPLAVNASLMLIALSVGLDSSLKEELYVLKRPGLLFKSLFSINIIVPTVAILVVSVLPLPYIVKAGIVLMAVSPLPPLVIGKEIKMGGRQTYVYGLLVAIAVTAIIVVPLSVVILSMIFPQHVSISPWAVARLVLTSVLIPVTVGVICHHIFPAASKRLSPMVNRFAFLLLLVAAIPILIAVWPAVSHLIGNGTVLAMAAIVAAALASGHLIGGEEPRDKVSLAIASATRHPGIALLIAHDNAAEKGVTAAILLFMIVGLLGCVPYQIWCKRYLNRLPGSIRHSSRMDHH